MILIILFLILLIIYIIKNTNYVYDLSIDRTFNYFEIYNIEKIKKQLPIYPNVSIIDNYLPEHIIISNFQDKGWGLLTNKSFTKDEIIYNAPIYIFPNNGIKITSKQLGVKNIEKDIHCGDIAKKHNLFSSYDCFLNHSDNPNAYHSNLFFIKNNAVYVVLKASRNIHLGDELTIDYIYLNKYIYYINSYITYLTSTIFY